MATALDEYYPFATGLGANVTEAQWRQMARLWRTTGVVPAGESGLNELAVGQRGAGANMSVDVATGWAWVLGEFGALTALENVGIAANATGNPRIDLVILRADFVNDVVELDVLVGTPAVAPVEPALTQNTSIWEIPLAAVDVAAAAVSILTANIRDRRTFTLSLPQLANKEPVRVATTTALAASTVTGTTRVANADGALAAIDGVTLVAGDRLLDKDHATTAQRGLWRVVDPGSASRPWIMERPADFDSSSDVRAAVWVKVAEGTTYADTGWLLTTNNPIVLGTTGLAFTQFPAAGATGGGGILQGFGKASTAITTATQLARLLNNGGAVSEAGVPFVMSQAGSITGITVESNSTRNAGSMLCEVYKNGVATGLTATIDGTNTVYAYGAQAVGLDTFAAGDRLDVRATNTAYGPSGALFDAQIIVQFT